MEVELSQKAIDAIAYKAATIVVSKLKAEDQAQAHSQMVSTKEAAAILGITPARMRQIADRFPHIKQGNNKQGKLLFLKKSLLKNY
jgi:hypothetical protein